MDQGKHHPEYISMLEEAQRKAHRGGIPIPEMQIVFITTQAVLDADKPLLTTLVREGNLPASKIWNEWKETYTEAENYRYRQLQAAGADGPFTGGNANTATHLLPTMEQGSDRTLDRLYEYMENLYLYSTEDKGFT